MMTTVARPNDVPLGLQDAIREIWSIEDHSGFVGMDNRFCIEHCIERVDIMSKDLSDYVDICYALDTYENLVNWLAEEVKLF